MWQSIISWFFDNPVEGITLMIALYGAGLSTAVFVANRRKDKRRLKVFLSTTPQVFGALDKELPVGIEFKAVNLGHRIVNLERLETATSDVKRVILQYKIDKDGESVQHRDSIPSLRNKLRSAQVEAEISRVYFIDAEGNRYGTSEFPEARIAEGLAVSNTWHRFLSGLRRRTSQMS